MQLVVGLGNPGVAYAATRHNVGFRVLDEMACRRGLSFTRSGNLYAWTEEDSACGKLVLLKPLTYMNLSGSAVLAWAERSGVRLVGVLPAEADTAAVTGGDSGPDGLATTRVILNPIVVCDDLTLPLGSLRIRARGSAGGQKGLAAIIEAVGGQDFPRIRLGIGPQQRSLDPEDWSSYVLQPFAPEEDEVVAALVTCAADAVACLLVAGVQKASTTFNRRGEA